MSESDIWNYFRKCASDDGERRAQCLFCENVFNYSSTIHNLKSHLMRRHSQEVQVTSITVPKTRQKSVLRQNNSVVWVFFTKLENEDKVALCNFCDKAISHKTTITNLKTHLRRIHPDEYNKFIKSFEIEQEDGDEDAEEIFLELDDDFECSKYGIQCSSCGTATRRYSANIKDNDASAGNVYLNEDSNQSTSHTPDVWSFFEQETGGRARCVVCRATMAHRVKDLKIHLKDNHPKLAQDFDETSDNENDQNDTYTEVVYLEDESRKSHKRVQHSKKRHSFKSSPILKAKKRKSSTSSDEFLREKTVDDSEDNDDQLGKFGTYITCLLKKMPKDVCMKLQMDIINLIMTTKLKIPTETPIENKVIIDGLPMAIQTVSAVPGTGYIVNVPANGDCGKQTVSVSEVKGDPLTHDNRDTPKISVGNTNVTQDMTLHNC